VFRCLTLTAALVLATAGPSQASVNFWLSGIGTTDPGSSFPASVDTVPLLEPYIGGASSVYIWGRPDAGKSLVNLSLNLMSETPNVISFTSVTLFNPSFGMPAMNRFEFVDDSNQSPPLPITANRIDSIEGFQVFNPGPTEAVGIGSASDSLYASPNNWLIAQVTYNALATGENSETSLYLEIGPVGMNHAGEGTGAHSVIFGDALDTPITDVVVSGVHVNRGTHPGNYDARIRPRPLPGDASRNGAVEQNDYPIWRANFGPSVELAADHNRNGVVDGPDYVIWRNNLGLAAGSGSGSAATFAIPEPPAALLMLMSFAGIAFLAIARLPLGRAK
jgi:hypothetical protein